MTQGMTAIGNPRTLTALLLHIRALGDLVKNPLIEFSTALPPPHLRTPRRPRIHRIHRRTRHRHHPTHRLGPHSSHRPLVPIRRTRAATAESAPATGQSAGPPLPRSSPAESATAGPLRRAGAQGLPSA